jgi:Fe-S cluster assembly protein SufB
MATENARIHEQLGRRYDAGFVTEIDTDTLAPGLSEDVIRFLSAKKDEPEWMTEWRLRAYRHWLTMPMPHWAKLKIAPIDFQAISYYAAPKAKYKSLDEVPQELLDTTRSWACRCTSALAWPASRSTRCSTRSRSAPRSARSWPRRA